MCALFSSTCDSHFEHFSIVRLFAKKLTENSNIVQFNRAVECKSVCKRYLVLFYYICCSMPSTGLIIFISYLRHHSLCHIRVLALLVSVTFVF